MKQGNALSPTTEHSRSMPKGWEMKKLGEVAKAIYGYTEKASFEEIGPRFLRITDIQDEGVNWETVPFCKITDADFNKYKLIDGDIVFARTGATTGKSYLVNNPPKSVFASYLIKVHINSGGLLPEYLFLFFQTKTYWDSINEGISGSAQGGFNATKLSDLYIPLPPLSEQQRIVAILDEAFAGIAKAKANAEQNLKNAKELFESYLQGVFENKGEGWEHISLGEICKINDGTHFSPKNTGDGEFMYITAKNIKPYYIDLTKISYISAEDHKEIYARCSPKKGDVLYIKDGATAGIAAINNFEEEFSLLSSVALLKCSSKILNTFLVHYMNSTAGRQNFLGYIDGAAITRLTLIKIKSVGIPLPPITEQEVLVKKFDALFAETKRLEAIYQQKINDLEELKKSVLQKAFIGELKTEKAEVTL
jgi:type I restriction enzyme S subunit